MNQTAASPDALPTPSAGLEYISCPLCGKRDETPVLEAADAHPGRRPALRFSVVRCKACSLTYTNPRPDQQHIGGFYPEDYAPHRQPTKTRKVRKVRNSLSDRLSGRRSPERDGVLPWVGTGRLLDFGCGGGSYLQRMSELGWQVTGLDVSADTVQQIRERLGLRALVGSLPHPELTPGSFEVVTMWQSIEHVHQPREVLQEIRKLLVPGGKLVVACPNLDSWAFRAFGTSWFGLDLPRHLTHFTPATLRDTMVAAGFRVTDQRWIRHAEWLRTSARLAVRNGTATALQRTLKWKPLAKMAGWLTYLRNTTDCMIAVAERPS